MFRLSLRQNVIAGYVLALLVLAVGWLAYRGADAAQRASAEAQRAESVVAGARAVGDHVREAQSDARAFLFSGDLTYLGPYRAAADGAHAATGELRTRAAPYPELDARVDSLTYFVGLQLAELDETVRLQHELGVRATLEIVRSHRGEGTMRQITRLLDSVDASMERRVAGDEARASADEQIALAAAITAGALALLLALFVQLMHARNIREQRRVTEELETQSFQLQIQAGELQSANAELESATRELVQQSAEAERNEAQLSGILGSATDAIVSFDDDMRIVYANSAAERLFGAEHGSMVHAPVRDFLSVRSIAGLEERMPVARRAAHTGSSSPELWDTLIEPPDGREVPVEVSMAYGKTGKQGLFTAVLRDVTRQRQLEDEFRQAQKMEAVGRLAGGIAHDFNNLLTVIGASSDFLLYDLRGNSDAIVADIGEIKRATDRAASLTRQLLAFSRRQLVQPQRLDLNAVVAEMETMLKRLIGEDVHLETSYGDEVWHVRLDRGQLEQIVVNLVVNARDAMPGGGFVRVRTGIECETDETTGREKEFVTLAVSDTGVGMDEETRARIFEPFFTTKEQGKGTGLGLSTVYGIVAAAGGDVDVTSELEVGTEFKLRLPRVEEETAAIAPAMANPGTLRGYETVLVVEDEDSLRRLTRRILEARGYTVHEAANGSEAIRVMATAQPRVDLLLSDVVMPAMGGRELVERLLPVYPWLRVLFMSGYTEDTMLQHRVAELGIAVLEKPFTSDDLALAVRNTLDRVSEPSETAAF